MLRKSLIDHIFFFNVFQCSLHVSFLSKMSKDPVFSLVPFRFCFCSFSLFFVYSLFDSLHLFLPRFSAVFFILSHIFYCFSFSYSLSYLTSFNSLSQICSLFCHSLFVRLSLIHYSVEYLCFFPSNFFFSFHLSF